MEGKILFDWFIIFGMAELICTQRKLLTSGSKSGKIKWKPKQQRVSTTIFTHYPSPAVEKPRKVCTVKTSTSTGREEKDDKRWYKKRSRDLDVHKQEIFLPEKSSNAPRRGCSFHGQQHCPFKGVEGEGGGACVCDWLYSPIRLCSCDALTRLYASLTANSPPLLAGF